MEGTEPNAVKLSDSRHSGEGQSSGAWMHRSRKQGMQSIITSLQAFKMDTRLGSGFLLRSTSCIHAVVRGHDDKKTLT